MGEKKKKKEKVNLISPRTPPPPSLNGPSRRIFHPLLPVCLFLGGRGAKGTKFPEPDNFQHACMRISCLIWSKKSNLRSKAHPQHEWQIAGVRGHMHNLWTYIFLGPPTIDLILIDIFSPGLGPDRPRPGCWNIYIYVFVFFSIASILHILSPWRCKICACFCWRAYLFSHVFVFFVTFVWQAHWMEHDICHPNMTFIPCMSFVAWGYLLV